MAIISIGGTNLKDPSTYEVEKFDIVKQITNLRGQTITDIIAKDKVKIKVGYNTMTGTELAALLSVINNNYYEDFYYSVTYQIPSSTTSYDSMIASISNRNFGNYILNSTKKIWKDVSFELIER